MVEYLIPFKGLSIGEHEYHFHVEDTFFVEKKSELINEGNLIINLTLNKQSRIMTSKMHIKGSIKLICDRCIDKFDYPIDVTYNQIFKFSNAPDIQEDDIIYLSDKESQLDISEVILENILLQIPIRKVHPDNDDGSPSCNAKQLELINKYAERKQSDPRWDALKNIKFDD